MVDIVEGKIRRERPLKLLRMEDQKTYPRRPYDVLRATPQ